MQKIISVQMPEASLTEVLKSLPGRQTLYVVMSGRV